MLNYLLQTFTTFPMNPSLKKKDNSKTYKCPGTFEDYFTSNFFFDKQMINSIKKCPKGVRFLRKKKKLQTEHSTFGLLLQLGLIKCTGSPLFLSTYSQQKNPTLSGKHTSRKIRKKKKALSEHRNFVTAPSAQLRDILHVDQCCLFWRLFFPGTFFYDSGEFFILLVLDLSSLKRKEK